VQDQFQKEMSMSDVTRRDVLKVALATGAAAVVPATAAAAEDRPSITIYDTKSFGGGKKTYTEGHAEIGDWNDKANSIHVQKGTWALFEDNKYQGLAVTVNAHGGPNGDGKYPDGSYYHNVWGVSSLKPVSIQG
jgi:hypothetical protein